MRCTVGNAGKVFGDLSRDAGKAEYAEGEIVSATFHAGCPRNNLRAEGTFLAGERAFAFS